ncbi:MULTISPECIES: response regulator [Pseudomonas]|uniref:response regulator n=1 Tax=Pseudomonas TaxID=286 RepID=UPI00285F0128|nr:MULTISPECIES: response regulator [Pseudomonas]MDR6927822.1 PAS domain S-box-containing protein [Pseudomonas sp. BE134]MDR7283493.1 PAS domain S-box-containing protein [Pseudomonas corrugata]
MGTVLLVDHLPIVRNGLRALLERAGHTVLAEVDNGQDALMQCRQLHPDMVIIELLVPRLGGLDLLRRLRASHEGIKLLVYSVQEASLYATRSLQAGADAFVSKTDAVTELESALLALSHGRRYFPREVTRQDASSMRDEGANELEQLSGRELTVLQMLSQGLNNKDIAEQLSLSYKTVSTYKARLHQKLKASNDFQLLEVARTYGLVAGEDPSVGHESFLDPQLLREYDLLRALLDSAPYPMFVRDLEGRLLMCNRRYLAYTGESFENIRGTTLAQAKWLPAQMRQDSEMRLRETVIRQESFMAEAVIENDGISNVMYVWCTPFRNEAGELVAMFGGMRDLTERDRLLTTLRHEGAEARYESHLKSSTLAAVSQELQVKIEAMQKSLKALLLPDFDPPERILDKLTRHVDSMRHSLARLDDWITLDAHDQETLREAHNLGALTEELLGPIRQQLESKGCQLNLGPGLRALKSAWIDVRHYRQLLESLFAYLVQGTPPPKVSLILSTRILPRGFLRLSLELSPWLEPGEDDPTALLGRASIQRLVLVLQGKVQTESSVDGKALVWRLELDLPQDLGSPP